jgi:hypothetical protein
MGILTTPIRLFQDLASLGGTYRIRAATKRFAGLSERHVRICERLSRYNNRLAELKDEVEEQTDIARSHLRVAGRMLKHAPGEIPEPVLSPAIGEMARVGEIDVPPMAMPVMPKSMKTTAPTVAGIGAGAATSAGKWITSTVILPAGADLTRFSARAGLAGLGSSFPGGASSVAALARAPLAIPGVGAMVGLAVSTGMSHSRANRLSVVCRKLQQTQTERSSDLEKLRAEVESLESLELRIRNQDRILWRTIRSIRKTLFPNGPLSHLRRLFSGYWRGNYYDPRELALIEQLDYSVAQFVNSLKSPPVSARHMEGPTALESAAYAGDPEPGLEPAPVPRYA